MTTAVLPVAALSEVSTSTNRLGADARRVFDFADVLSTRLDVLVEAAQSENWTEVRRCAEAITRVDLPRACAELASSAAQLCEQIARPASRRDVQLSLAKLIGAGASALEVARTCQHDDVAE